MSIVGYVRVSTGTQHVALRLDTVRAAGAEKIFEDHATWLSTPDPRQNRRSTPPGVASPQVSAPRIAHRR